METPTQPGKPATQSKTMWWNIFIASLTAFMVVPQMLIDGIDAFGLSPQAQVLIMALLMWVNNAGNMILRQFTSQPIVRQ